MYLTRVLVLKLIFQYRAFCGGNGRNHEQQVTLESTQF